jgi:hypothetical protein
MRITLAYDTLRLFHECVMRDQGGAYRQNLQRVIPHIGDAYRGEEEGFRSHLGASVLGRECDRQVWYSFRWATKSRVEGRMVRLWNRGHLEEARFIALMLTAGFQVYQQDEHGKQYRISEYGGHFGGSGDGVVSGVPELASSPFGFALAEFKTHNDKSFKKLAGDNWDLFHKRILDPNSTEAKVRKAEFEGEGVRSAKFEHWVQMQLYMEKMGLSVALYCAVNKNDDHIYAELVHRDSAAANFQLERAGRIIPLYAPPRKIANSVGDYRCMFCDHKPVCHQGAKPEANCRTCKHSEPDIRDGKWRCANPVCTEGGQYEAVLDKATQLTGCSWYEQNPNI